MIVSVNSALYDAIGLQKRHGPVMDRVGAFRHFTYCTKGQ